jgi:hypothetical protein
MYTTFRPVINRKIARLQEKKLTEEKQPFSRMQFHRGHMHQPVQDAMTTFDFESLGINPNSGTDNLGAQKRISNSGLLKN